MEDKYVIFCKSDPIRPISIIDKLKNSHVMELSKEQVTNILGLGGIYYIDDNKITGINNFVGEKYVR